MHCSTIEFNLAIIHDTSYCRLSRTSSISSHIFLILSIFFPIKSPLSNHSLRVTTVLKATFHLYTSLPTMSTFYRPILAAPWPLVSGILLHSPHLNASQTRTTVVQHAIIDDIPRQVAALRRQLHVETDAVDRTRAKHRSLEKCNASSEVARWQLELVVAKWLVHKLFRFTRNFGLSPILI